MAWITKPKRKNNNRCFNQSSKYYNTKQWHILRNDYIRHNPLCERCLSCDRVTAAEHVHHITPFLTGDDERERMKLLLDRNNLMSVCQKCHRIIHEEINHRG